MAGLRCIKIKANTYIIQVHSFPGLIQEEEAEQHGDGHSRQSSTLACRDRHYALSVAEAGQWTGAAGAIFPSERGHTLTCQQDTREGDGFGDGASPGATPHNLLHPNRVTFLQFIHEVASVEGCVTSGHLRDRSGG